nr:M15 family metallopeptidase [Ruminococcus sp. OA3]
MIRRKILGDSNGGAKQRMKKRAGRNRFIRSLILSTAVLLLVYLMHNLAAVGYVTCVSAWTAYMEEAFDEGRANTDQAEVKPEPAAGKADTESTESADQDIAEPVGVIDKKDWKLILLNADHPMPDDYELLLTDLGDGQQFDMRAVGALQGMLEAARSQGLSPVVCSAYRSEERQEELFEEQVLYHMEKEGMSQEEAETEARRHVSYARHSEHGLGLAADIVSEDYQELEKEQEETPEYRWLLNNCADYGFILRYPEDKTEITGVIYEPWHFRYVGKYAAYQIMSRGITLEEYLEEQ